MEPNLGFWGDLGLLHQTCVVLCVSVCMRINDLSVAS